MLVKLTEESLTAIANAIRTKATIGSDLEFPQGFIDAIESIHGGDTSGWKTEFVKYLAGAACNIPDTVTDLRDYAFYKFTNMTQAMFEQLPDGLETIGDYCFADITALQTIDLSGKSLVSIGDYAFSGCSGITTVDLSDNDISSLGERALAELGSLTSLDLSGNTHLSVIPAYFAYKDTNLATMDFTDCPIVTVGDYAFYTSNGSKSILFPFEGFTTLKIIGDHAFYSARNYFNYDLDLSGCTSLETISPYAFQCQPSSGNTQGIQSLVLPASLVSIGEMAFYQNGITSADFSRCSNLETIGASAFRRSGATMAALDLSNCSSLVSIGANCFYDQYGTHKLNALILPAHTLQTIGSYAFSGCGLVNTTSLAAHAQRIEGNAFQGATALTRVDIYDATYLGTHVFQGCTSLTQAHIHTKPTSFPNNIATYPVFDGCTNLTDIYVSWSSGEVAENRFVKSSQSPTWHYNYQW